MLYSNCHSRCKLRHCQTQKARLVKGRGWALAAFAAKANIKLINNQIFLVNMSYPQYVFQPNSTYSYTELKGFTLSAVKSFSVSKD